MKTNSSGKKCTCDHFPNEHHKRLNPLVEGTVEDKGYLTNGEWLDKHSYHGTWIETWLPAECRKCDCKQYTPIKRKWTFWK